MSDDNRIEGYLAAMERVTERHQYHARIRPVASTHYRCIGCDVTFEDPDGHTDHVATLMAQACMDLADAERSEKCCEVEDDLKREIRDLQSENDLLRQEVDAEEAHQDGKECEICTHLQLDTLMDENQRLQEENDILRSKEDIVERTARLAEEARQIKGRMDDILKKVKKVVAKNKDLKEENARLRREHRMQQRILARVHEAVTVLDEVAYSQIAHEKVMTIQPTGPHRAQVPPHWRTETNERARPYIAHMQEALDAPLPPEEPEPEPIDCVCQVDPNDLSVGLCVGVPGESEECKACLALDPEAPCLQDEPPVDL